MYFTTTDTGPFYLKDDEKKKMKFDKIVGMKKINYTKPDLILKLKSKGIKNPKGGTKKLQHLCRTNNIPTA